MEQTNPTITITETKADDKDTKVATLFHVREELKRLERIEKQITSELRPDFTLENDRYTTSDKLFEVSASFPEKVLVNLVADNPEDFGILVKLQAIGELDLLRIPVNMSIDTYRNLIESRVKGNKALAKDILRHRLSKVEGTTSLSVKKL